MISFFKISTAYKYLFLILIFLSFRIFVILYAMPSLQMELNWLVVAQKMNQGYALYKEIWDKISPLAALVYSLLYGIVGNQVIIYHIIAVVLILWQAFTFNTLLIRRQILQENTLIPALVYCILMGLFIDFYTLTPFLLANTFLLLVIKHTFLHINEKNKIIAVFEIGAYIGIASLFYLPSILLLSVPLLAFLLFTSTPILEYFIMCFSLFFTLLIAFLIFYVNETEYYFYSSFLSSIFNFTYEWYLPWWQILTLWSGSMFLVISLLLTPAKFNRYNNYQNRCSNVMFLWFFVSLCLPFAGNVITPSSFMLAVPAMTFLLSHYFLNTRQSILKELFFLVWFGSIVYINYENFYKITQNNQYQPLVDYKNLITKTIENPNLTYNKKVLVIGKSWQYYQNAQLATPYFNYTLAQRHFSNLDRYDILIAVYDNFRQDPPDVIIDEKQMMEKIFTQIPLLAQNYEKLDAQTYIKKTTASLKK